MADQIRIVNLELKGRVGVPEAERENPQRLTVSMTLTPASNFRALGDEIGRTVDYAAVCEATKAFVQNRSDKLIETMAHELASHLLEKFSLKNIELELKKYVLPETEYVSVMVTRDL